MESVEFLCTLAGVNTAAKWLAVGGDGDCKLSLEVPASELDQVIRLKEFRGKTLRVTVVED